MDDVDKFLDSLGLYSTDNSSHLANLGSAVSIVIASLIGFLILLTYIKTAGKDLRDRNIFPVIPILTILMAVIMRIEGAQILLFFGIFGILSIVRFRSEITDQKGISFILFAVIEGVLIGVNNYLLAFSAFVLVTLSITIANSAFPHRSRFDLSIKIDKFPSELKTEIESLFKEFSLNFSYRGFKSVQVYLQKKASWAVRTQVRYVLSCNKNVNFEESWQQLSQKLQLLNLQTEIRPGSED